MRTAFSGKLFQSSKFKDHSPALFSREQDLISAAISRPRASTARLSAEAYRLDPPDYCGMISFDRFEASSFGSFIVKDIPARVQYHLFIPGIFSN